MNAPPDHFATARLIARRTRLGDAAAIFAGYAADPEVTRYLAWRPHASVESVADYLRSAIAAWAAGSAFRYELCLTGTDHPVGSIELRPEPMRVAFGYVLARDFWGRGLMTEALTFGVDWALAQPEVFRAFALCDVENPGSARVMAKAGMTREGLLRRWLVCPNLGPEPRDCWLYAKVR